VVCEGPNAVETTRLDILLFWIFPGEILMLDFLKYNALALKNDRKAVTAIEYALIAALIAVVIIGAVTTLGGSVASTFNSVSSEL
jgi:pilus assembly protein Flp/PilA